MHRAKKIRIRDADAMERQIAELRLLEDDGLFSEARLRNSIARYLQRYLGIERRYFCCDFTINRDCLFIAFTNAVRSPKDSSRGYRFVHTLVARQFVERNVDPPIYLNQPYLNEYVAILFFIIGMVPKESHGPIIATLSELYRKEDKVFSQLQELDPDTSSDFVDLVDFILLKCQFE